MHIAVRPKACTSCRPAYGPLITLDPRPGRPPAKPLRFDLPHVQSRDAVQGEPNYLVSGDRTGTLFIADAPQPHQIGLGTAVKAVPLQETQLSGSPRSASDCPKCSQLPKLRSRGEKRAWRRSVTLHGPRGPC